MKFAAPRLFSIDFQQNLHDLFSGSGYTGTGAEDGGYTCIV
jgi:hypothetical protein